MITHAKTYRWLGPVAAGGIIFVLLLFVFARFYKIPRKISGLGILLIQGELTEILSTSNAILDSWLLEEGDVLKNNQVIALLRTPQNSTKVIVAPKNGVLAEIIAYPGTTVSSGETLGLITAYPDPKHHLELIGFVSSLEGKKIKAGMTAHVWPSVTDAQKSGAMLATVRHVGKLPMTKAAVQSIIKIPGLAKYIRNNIEAEPFLVILRLDKNPQQPQNYLWTKAPPNFELDSGIIAHFDIIYAEPSLLERGVPFYDAGDT